MGIIATEDWPGDWPGDWHAALAALAWQADLGVTEAMGEAPRSRYEDPAAKAEPVAVSRPAEPVAVASPRDPAAEVGAAVEEARARAAGAVDLAALRAAVEAYPHCELKRGARNTVFADGLPGARVMIIGEAPGRDEDLEGRPFVGRAGQLLDRMLAAIGLDRRAGDAGQAVYITNVLPWRPPGNRDPEPAEIAMMQPFLARHVDLAAPEVLVVMGNAACAAVLGQRGILRLRGTWAEAYGRPVLPMTHPAYLLRQPHAKREAWADLLALQARMRGG
jgi:DNA polymerase